MALFSKRNLKNDDYLYLQFSAERYEMALDIIYNSKDNLYILVCYFFGKTNPKIFNMDDIQVTLSEEDFDDLSYGVYRGYYSIIGGSKIERRQDELKFFNKNGIHRYFHLDKVKNGTELLKDFYEAHKTH